MDPFTGVVTNHNLAFNDANLLTNFDNVLVAYRPNGLRAWVSGSNDPNNPFCYYVYSGDKPLYEMQSYIDEHGQRICPATAVYSYGATGLEQIYYPDTRQIITLTFDPQGCVVSHQTDMMPTDFQQFDAFGQQLFCFSVLGMRDGLPNNFLPQIQIGWAGQAGAYTDTNFADLVLLTHRYYSPSTGRFITRDPIGYGGGINEYAYTRNNPVMKADPSGLDPDKINGLILLTKDAGEQIGYVYQFSVQQVARNPVQDFTIATGVSGSVVVSGTTVGSAFLTVAPPVAIVAGGTFLAVQAYHHVGVPLGNWAFGPQTLGSAAAPSWTAQAWATARLGKQAASIAKGITGKYGNLQCDECAAALKSAFVKQGIHGNLLNLRGEGRFVVSKTYGPSAAISENHNHTGIQVGNLVFDNIHKSGISYQRWVRDFNSPGGITVNVGAGF